MLCAARLGAGLLAVLMGFAACRGDPSDEFRFATFFPEVTQPAVDRILNAVPCGRSRAGQAVAAHTTFSSLPGSGNADTARRR